MKKNFNLLGAIAYITTVNSLSNFRVNLRANEVYSATGDQFQSSPKVRSLGYGGPQAQHTRNHTRNYRSFDLNRKG
jgi:hypothetical protein